MTLNKKEISVIDLKNKLIFFLGGLTMNNNGSFWLASFEFFVWGILLTAATVILYYIGNYFVSLQEHLNFYFFGILSGATGAIWGYGMTVAHENSKMIKGEESFEYHLWHRIVVLIISIVILVVMGCIISM